MPAFVAAIGGVVGALKGTAVFKFLTTKFVGRLLASVALSALQTALAPRPPTPGITTQYTATGGTNPCGFVLGQYAQAGDAVCPPMTHGTAGRTPNAYLTYVIALGDVAGPLLERVMIDGAYVDLGTVADPDYGLPATGTYAGFAWFKYYDGSQTVADPMLLARYGTYPERPWLADMVGTGVPYVICTFLYNRSLYQSLPSMLFQCGGIKLYDPRKDTTAGGAGAHRWGDATTYEASRNSAVIAYNIKRGITLAGLGIWGGSIEAVDLPVANWFSAMNACDTMIGEPAVVQFQAGYEVRVDMEPAAVIEEVLKGCTGQVAEVGGSFKIRVGGPGLPVLFITDDDIIVTRPQDYNAFPQADQRQNGIDAKYPDPGAIWQPKSAPSRYNTTWETEDGARRVASLDLPACPFPEQVQRVMNAYITDERRFRRHGLTLPPDAAVLEPLDTISWTSARNGYAAKLFELSELVDELPTVLQRIGVRECDPADYSWSPGFALPVSVPSAAFVAPAAQVLDVWAVTPVSITDATGAARRPAIRMSWATAGLQAVDAVQYQVRVKATAAMVKRGTVSEVEGGEIIVSDGIMPNVIYQARGLSVVRGRTVAWTAWTDVTSPNVGLDNTDFVGGAYGTLLTSQGLYAIRDVTVLPGAGTFVGEKVFNRTDGKLWQWTGAAWQLAVADVAPGSVGASKLLLSDATNVFPDFDIEDVGFYASATGAAFTFATTASQFLGRKFILVPANVAVHSVESGWFSVEPSTEYLVSASAALSSATAGSGTSTVSVETGTMAADGTVAVSTSTPVATRTDSTSFAPISVSVVTGPTIRRMRFVLTRTAGGTAAGRGGGYKVQKKAITSLIGDLQVNTLQLADNAATIPVYAFAAATIAMTATFADVATLSITRAGLATRLEFSAMVRADGADGTASVIAFDIYRGGTLLQSFSAVVIAYLAKFDVRTYVFTDTDTGSGATTYTVKAKNDATYACAVANRFLGAHQFKK